MNDNDLENLFSELEDIFNDVENDESVVNLQTLDTVSLMDKVNGITQTLLEMGEALHPKTQEARELHSERNACQLELVRRGVL